MGFIDSIVAASLLLSTVSAAVLPRDGIDYGSCSNPTINWTKDKGFFPANSKDFDHSPTTEIAPIYEYVCSTLDNKCKAPLATGWVCLGAQIEAKFNALTGQAQADAFNNHILYKQSVKPTPVTPPAVPQKSAGANVTVLFSKAMVEIEGHIDPKWWFDNKINPTKDTPMLCPEEPYRMPNNYWIGFDCTGADATSLPLMRSALNAMVDATIDNKTASDDERLFKHVTTYKKNCRGGDPVEVRDIKEREGPACTEWTRKYTVMPKSVHIAISDTATPGGKGFFQGELRYIVSNSKDSANCKMCAFFGAAGGGTAAVASATAAVVQTASKVLGPGIGFLGALISISCLAAC